MGNNSVIASSLQNNELAQAFSELVAERWDNWDLSPFMAYLVDVCTPSALPYLAEQFDVEGLQGFAIADTVQQQRDIIKRSIALHKFIGTPWAIREACRTVGFPVIVLEESVTAIPGGPTSPDDWARFRVLVEADPTRHITEEEARKLRLFVEFYKNQRSHLVELGFYLPLVEEDHIFRKLPTDCDILDIVTLSVSPNPAIIDPSGTPRKIYISASAPWLIYEPVKKWGDGSEDEIRFEFSGTAGESEITIVSDPNMSAEREITVSIHLTDGRELGIFTVRQPKEWKNAYSRAYSNAYNLYPPLTMNAYSRAYSLAYNLPAYIRISPPVIELPADPQESVVVEIESNSKWKIE